MKRKKFLRNSMIGLSGIIGIPSLVSSSSDPIDDNVDPISCVESPKETAGPFTNKTPAQLVKENIIGNRSGIPLMLTFNIQNTNNNCNPLAGALVDIWHCDAHGNYSQYNRQLDGNFTHENFLRGRQTTDSNGNVSFISIFPGWYPGRTPHIHLEVKSRTGNSLLITQVSWSDDVSNTVYTNSAYKGLADTNNSNDGIVSNANLADELTGNTTDGYVLKKVIKVAS